jgi:hypothetical protein
MHLDPDFEYLTYGDNSRRRGARMLEMGKGDLLVFYGGLRPVHVCEQKLIYALLGMYVLEKTPEPVDKVPKRHWHKNAHVRRKPREDDIVVWAARGKSGRFERCIAIGEYRDHAYRVRKDLLDAWGGLSVKDGYIQAHPTKACLVSWRPRILSLKNS